MSRLVNAHGRPSLGNFRDPIKEIFYILLSARTTELLYQRAHKRLFSEFPSVGDLAEASVEKVMQCIDRAGLGRKRAAQVVCTARRLLDDFGTHPQPKLRKMSSGDCFTYLSNLPGLGPKSSLCIMMYSLDFDVFPVDVNIQRIAERIGVIPKGLKHYQAQKLLPSFVPNNCGKDLHIGLVVHGRQVCLPIRPKCAECVIADLCRSGRRYLRKKANGVENATQVS
jgi:endonuclease III